VIFMSQSGLLDRTRDEEWDRWYVEHLRAMVTVPGISAAQRFRTDSPVAPPSLAMYSVVSPAVFDDPHYLGVRGFRDWQRLIDPRFYRRNLFEGLEHGPDVAEDERLLVADRDRPGEAIAGIELVWLESVGLDRSTPFRGLAVVVAADLPELEPTVAVYRPMTARIVGSARSRPAEP
jgi:hypothetical protein